MRIVNVYPMYQKTALTTRGSAHILQDEVSSAVRDGEDLALDLSGIRMVTPSFLDQLLFMMEDSLPSKSAPIRLLMLNGPEGLRDKMESIGGYHQLKVISDEQGEWLLSHK